MKRWVIAMLLCGLCHIGVFAHGYDQNTQSKNWGYQPVYNSGTTMPTYQFRTTSAYIRTSGDVGSYRSKPRRSGSSGFNWGDDYDDDYEPGGNTVGEVDDDPVPVGDTPWLLMLLLAGGYIAYRSMRRRTQAGETRKE